MLNKDLMKCWQVKKCGHENEKSCPAIVTHHERTCWRVAGTLCGGTQQGTMADKLANCKVCDYYVYVQKNAS